MTLPAVLSNLSLFFLRNEFDFWSVHGTMNTSGLLQSKTLQKTRSIHDSMNRLNIEFITYIKIL